MVYRTLILFLLVPVAALCFTYGYQNNDRTGKPDKVVIGLTPTDVAGLPGYTGLLGYVFKSVFTTYSGNRQAEINNRVTTNHFNAYSTTTQGKLNAKASLNGVGTSGTWPISVSGTSTAFATTPTTCSGQAAIGIDVHGNAQGCYTPPGTYVLPWATNSVLGGVKTDATFNNHSGAISVKYGTTANTAAQGNDSRIIGAVQQTTTINGHPLSSNVTVSASDITTGTLPHAQLPALVSGDIPNNAANTTGSAAKLTTPITINGVSFDGTTNILLPTGVKVGTFTRSLAAASGTQSIIGIGFTPSAILITGSDDVSSLSNGFSDGINTGCSFQLASTTGHTSKTVYLTEPGWAYAGIVTSMDVDGFTITWTTIGTGVGTGTFYYQAFR